LAVALGVMGWLSVTVLRLERAEEQARRMAEHEENVRLALWRMDSALSPVIAGENARPYFVYRSFYPLERAFGNMFGNNRGGEFLMPSPLLKQPSPYVLLHFQIDPNGAFTSPQIPQREAATLQALGLADQCPSPEEIQAATKRLKELSGFLRRDELLGALPKEELASGQPVRVPLSSFAQNANWQANPNGSPSVLANPNFLPNANEQVLDNNDNWNTDGKGQGQQLEQPSVFQSRKNVVERGKRQKSYEDMASQEKQQAKLNLPQVLNDPQAYNGAAQRDQQRQQAAPQSSSPRRQEEPAAKMQEAQQGSERLSQQQSRSQQQAPVKQTDVPQQPAPQVPAPNKPVAPPQPPSPQPNIAMMLPQTSEAPVDPAHVAEGVTRPLWIGKSLILARRCMVREQLYVQGCWLDWPRIDEMLRGEIADLLPQARLVSVSEGGAEQSGLETGNTQAYMLAALPVRLEPGVVTPAISAEWSPLRLSLVIAWVCVVLAAIAIAALLLGALALSERRGAFVSAVTHELRTPLTTFRLYTEMLAGGMVPTETQRQQYLHTLRVEAERLSHLVENVLAYARLERGRTGNRLEAVAIGALLQRVSQRLQDRAVQAEMKLVVPELDVLLSQASVRTDPAAVEQILFNLVDNACKYANHSSGPFRAGEEKNGKAGTEARPTGAEAGATHAGEISIHVLTADRFAEVRVSDSGPGLSQKDVAHLFQPFSKSARDAAHSAPGVGLGLALSRRLARAMGGELRLDRGAAHGACFVLTMPLIQQ
jgi:signal transduction histidine kinase